MAGRVVLFGATGYTGRLTAEAMAGRGMRPVLAGRSRSKLDALATELGGLEVAVADVGEPATVRALVERGDVLVTTVGPFARWGSVAAEAAVSTGAHYLDSTGEPAFIREVFEHWGEGARAAGCGMLTAFGYDWVPGNLAGGLALERAGDAAVRVDLGYFMTGRASSDAMSGGTRASLMGALVDPGFAYRDGRVVPERGARRYRSFDVAGKRIGAGSVGMSEHYALPRVAPQLREVNGYLGWFGPLSRAMQVVSAASAPAMAVPPVRNLWDAAARRLAPGSTGGPGPETRAKTRTHVIGIAYDATGRPLAEVAVTGANGYDFTADILAWGAERAAAGGLRDAGALGALDGVGLRELEEGCAQAGLTASGAAPRSGSPAQQAEPAR
jgi:short subunit dehydrogenase-like uncharacterized protein